MAPTQRIVRLQWLAFGLIALGAVIQFVGNGSVTEVVSSLVMMTGFMWFITWSAIQSVLCPGRIWVSVLKTWLMLHTLVLLLMTVQLLNLWFQGHTTRLSNWANHWSVVSGVSFATIISLLATMFWVGGWKWFRIRLRDRLSGDPITSAKVSLVDLMLLTTVVAIYITVARLQQKWVFEPNEGFLGPAFAFFIVLMVCLTAGFMGWLVVLLPTWVSMARHWSVLRRRVVWKAFYLAWAVLAAIAWIGNWTEPNFWITFLVTAGWIVCNLLLVHWLVVKHLTFIGLEWYRLPKVRSEKVTDPLR
ncbi:hypothetical protein [Rhodopirellula sp. P2]|uniref:hypothetical protein n=1 Tax=Rhodopirellula sp. P2 TaxID=2127060 RepID=UPI002368530E|nr:hypothetical protein [Rhodopirellula sp. P2]WDQ17679.1 hypothetical protein PSR62_03790 [Rhodopirellula sp. P2]